jgi:hypothetical protein
MMTLERKLKIALDESRLLILGAQVLFGFQFNGIFQELFDELPRLSRALAAAGLTLLMATIGLLVAPSMQHRIAEQGQDSPRVLAIATISVVWALLPLSIALAFDVFIAMDRIAGTAWGAGSGAGFFVLAMLFWFGPAFVTKRRKQPMARTKSPKPTPLETQVEQLLTEARVIIPGAQALLGFQLTVTLTRAFQQLPADAKLLHAAALFCVGVAVVLLMAPASLHRISFAGEDDPEFLRIASMFVIAAPAPVALGIALDTYVAAGRALESASGAAAMAITTAVVLFGLWYAFPLSRRFAGKTARR